MPIENPYFEGVKQTADSQIIDTEGAANEDFVEAVTEDEVYPWTLLSPEQVEFTKAGITAMAERFDVPEADFQLIVANFGRGGSGLYALYGAEKPLWVNSASRHRIWRLIDELGGDIVINDKEYRTDQAINRVTYEALSRRMNSLGMPLADRRNGTGTIMMSYGGDIRFIPVFYPAKYCRNGEADYEYMGFDDRVRGGFRPGLRIK